MAYTLDFASLPSLPDKAGEIVEQDGIRVQVGDCMCLFFLCFPPLTSPID